MKQLYYSYIIALLSAFFFTAEGHANNTKIEVIGVVRGNEQEPLAGVTISISDRETVGATDDNGRFKIAVPKECALRFSSIGYASETVKIKGQRSLVVILKSTAVDLDEVIVIQEIKNKILPDPTDIEADGDYFRINTRFKIPDELFKTATRLIIQPSIINTTKGELYFLTPVVCDGDQFAIRQMRLHAYEPKHDPLNPYIVRKEAIEKGYLSYADSFKIVYPDDDYRADVQILIESCCKTTFQDSLSMARGVINPLRFLQFAENAMWMDDRYAPEKELVLREEDGNIELTFEVRSSNVDLSLANNQQEIDKIQSRLKQIESAPGSVLQSLDMYGSASPDGRYASNKRLAKSRLQSAMDLILSQLHSNTRNQMLLSAEAGVVEWSAVADSMEKDGRDAEVKKMRYWLRKYADDKDEQSSAMRYLPFYKTISDTYLPRFRKVNYKFTYSINRELTDSEIAELYAKDRLSMTAYELWRNFLVQTSSEAFKQLSPEEALSRQKELYQEMLKLYPKMTWAANNYSVLLLNDNKPDEKMLLPFANANAQEPILINQALVYLKQNDRSRAAYIANMFPNTERARNVKAMIAVYNHNYDEAYELIKDQNSLNKVLLLLKMKYNKEAYEASKLLEAGNAQHEYIRAVCANRLGRVNEAYIHFDQATALDPSLEAVAMKDGDLNNLF